MTTAEKCRTNRKNRRQYRARLRAAYLEIAAMFWVQGTITRADWEARKAVLDAEWAATESL